MLAGDLGPGHCQERTSRFEALVSLLFGLPTPQNLRLGISGQCEQMPSEPACRVVAYRPRRLSTPKRLFDNQGPRLRNDLAVETG